VTKTANDKKSAEDWVSETHSIPSHWLNVNFDDVFETLAINEFKIAQKDYLIQGKFPVIDQGVPLIGGYTNTIEKVIRNQGYLIIFGDHTRCLKLVNFDFAPGADGIKILKPRNILNPQYYSGNKIVYNF
jgi:type I restriction enzyme S subunit